MDDNKHSVNVSECDWESLQVCTDRDLLPSGLAGLDSGISDTSVSDTDNAGSLSLDRSLQAKLGERSPVEHFLNRHGVGCLENVLSGSEDEDVHLESINRFFERLKSLPVDEQRTDHCQATPELRDKVAQVCVDGPQAKDSTLPISNTEFHFLSATSGPDNTNALKKNRTDFQMTPEIPVSDAREGEKDKSTNPKVELVISDDWLLVTATTNDAKRQKYEGQSCEILKVVLEMSADSLRSAASGKMLNLQLAVCQRVDDERHRKIPTDQTFLRKSLDSCANPRKDSSSNVVVGPGAMVTAGEYPAAQRESSMNQSLSTTKRKRRRKKRVSMEPVDEGQRPFLANRDSDDEKCVLGSEMDAHVQISRHYTASCEHDSECERIKSASQTQNLQCPPLYSEMLKRTAINNVQYGSTTAEHDQMSLQLPNISVRYRQRLMLTELEDSRQDKAEPPDQEDKWKMNKSFFLANNKKADNLPATSDWVNVAGDIPQSRSSELKSFEEFKECHGVPELISRACLVSNEEEFGPENIVKYQNESQSLHLQKIHGNMTNVVVSSQAGNRTESTEHKAALKKDNTHISKAGCGVCNSDTMQSHANENIVVKLRQDTNSKSLSSEVVSTNATLEPIKALCTINSFNDPCCSEFEDVMNQTTYNQAVNQDSTTERPEKESRVTSSCISGTLKSTTDSNQEDEVNDIDENNVTETDALTPEKVSVTQTSTYLSRISTSTNTQTDERELVGLQSIEELVIAAPDKRNSEDTPAKLSEESDSPDIQTRFNSQETTHSVSVATGEREMSEHDRKYKSQDTSEVKVDVEVKTMDTDTTTKSPERDEIEEASDQVHPVYAISAFWNEMEKLTIKDILQLRTVSNAQHSSVNLKPTKSETVDISKAISDNQGYFSYVDDSKPDCSSGDRSITSTIADEFSQNPTVDNPSTDSIKNNESTNSIGIFGESKLDASSYKAGLYSENVPALSSISNIPKPHSSACTQPDFRRISKNVSVQNLLALGAEPLRRVLKGQSSTSVILVEEKPGIDSCGDGNTGCLAYNGSVRQDSSMDTLPAVNISKGVSTGSNRFFTEVKKFFFGSKKPEARPPSPDNMSTYYVNSGSVPEYEHFCSEFDEGGFSHPIKDAFGNRKNNLVPIYSCSRLDKHNLQFPEAYDYLFSSDSSSDSGEEDSCSPIRMITRLNQRPDETQGFTVAQDMYENVFTDDDPSENFFWNTNLSLRKIGLVGSTNQKRGSDSLSRVPLINNKRPYIRSIESISVLGSEDKTFSDQLLYSVEGKLFRQLAEQQRRYPDLQVAVANPRFDASLIPLKQSDMCLVCIAFASWVLKSTNPDAGDTWKAVILANLSALSAIRYLRRSKATGEKPKTQNTSAIV